VLAAEAFGVARTLVLVEVASFVVLPSEEHRIVAMKARLHRKNSS